MLSYIPGTAVVEPYPDWALTDEALVSVAELLRAYHDAASTFDPSPYSWAPPPPEGFVGDIVTHNDINLDNVVFRDGRAVALIDFDLAGPGSRAWDVACAARLWAPLRPRVYISDTRRGREFERFRLFVDSYGMNDSDRMKVAEGVQQNYKWFYHLIKTSAASGHAAFAKLWTFKTSVAGRTHHADGMRRTNRTFAPRSVSKRSHRVFQRSCGLPHMLHGTASTLSTRGHLCRPEGGGPVRCSTRANSIRLLPFVYSGGLRGLPYGHGRPRPGCRARAAATQEPRAWQRWVRNTDPRRCRWR